MFLLLPVTGTAVDGPRSMVVKSHGEFGPGADSELFSARTQQHAMLREAAATLAAQLLILSGYHPSKSVLH